MNPTDIAAALMTAERLYGEPIECITVKLRNGRSVVFPVATPGGGDEDAGGGRVGQGRRPIPPSGPPDEESLTDMQRDVLSAVRGMTPGETLTYQQIADKAGYTNSGHLRKFLKSLEIVDVSASGVKRLPEECPEPAQ